MTRMRSLVSSASSGLTAAVLLCAATIPNALADPPSQASAPLVITDQGSFYVHGQLTPIQYPCGTSQPPIPGYCAPGQIATGQIYVQYQIPENKGGKRAYPIIFVHGGSHAGQAFDTTPDGREGWRTLFVRYGFPAYVVDEAGVARSSFDPELVNQALITNNPALIPAVGIRISTLEQIWPFYRIGPQYPTLNTGSQFPAEAVTQYLSQMVPNSDGFLTPSSNTVRLQALAELLDKIGPAIVVTWSASGPRGFSLVGQRPGLVKALISVEPAGCSVPVADRPAFVGVPTLILFGDFTSGSAACQNTANALTQRAGMPSWCCYLVSVSTVTRIC